MSASSSAQPLLAPSALLVFDFDSTLVREESLVTLLEYALREELRNNNSISDDEKEKRLHDALSKVMDITNQGIKGEIPMTESYARRLSVASPTMKHVKKYLERSMDSVITPKMDTIINNVRENYPVPIHVISQGPRIIVEYYSKLLFGIPSENIHAVDVNFPEDGADINTHQYLSLNDEMLVKGKSAVLQGIIDKINIDHTDSKVENIIVVGDGVSDMNMKHNGPATIAIGFGANLLFQKTKELADYFVLDCDQLNQVLTQQVLRDCVTFNFYPGPATIPTEVMLKARDNLLCFDKGISIMEYSHRAPKFMNLMDSAEKKLRELVNIPDDYAVLFLQGGAFTQFSAIPLNLCENTETTAIYVVSGTWSKKAYQEAKAFMGGNAVQFGLDEINNIKNDESYSKCSYVYYCENETVQGVEKPSTFLDDIANDGKILVCDMSSNFLSRPVDIRKYGLVYACAQKNFGIAGLTIVIIRKDLIKEKENYVPSMLDFQELYQERSLLNTPVTTAIYMADLIFDWIKQHGGLSAMDELAQKRANLLYNCIEKSSFFDLPIKKEFRSRMNVVFKIKDVTLEKTFIKEAERVGLIGLAGHRSVGGFRASVYNGMPLKGVERLVQFIRAFENIYNAQH
ncbi:hypothetical protein C9374_010187 [Naegleria lovaniensis]|uniref:phosphoserine transaminase n=1 Tax=Naegleria lovaniensis TaxID=51637 RepID=A0AA88KEN4_NAELO|nr:uncharacterized protein C9374_010187 [Naegleria lovaniensis]KAG2375183.1 hypothetical protein C9374_010187 [Naegleria lovaniensis]